MTKLIAVFRNFANVPNKENIRCVELRKHEDHGSWRKMANEEFIMRHSTSIMITVNFTEVEMT
jgi:hypothetical protein